MRGWEPDQSAQSGRFHSARPRQQEMPGRRVQFSLFADFAASGHALQVRILQRRALPRMGNFRRPHWPRTGSTALWVLTSARLEERMAAGGKRTLGQAIDEIIAALEALNETDRPTAVKAACDHLGLVGVASAAGTSDQSRKGQHTLAVDAESGALSL